jgi:hypothetical protein
MIGLPYLYITVGPEIDELIAANLGLGKKNFQGNF